jgi:hypothetical protein
MKRMFGFVLLAILILDCTYSLNDYAGYKDVEPIIVSERVGEAIDPMERTQFDLFHGITNFESAAYFVIREGGYEVQVMADGKRYTAVNRDFHAIEIIRDRIDRFEEIQGSPEAFESKWRIVDL